jgi:hypothetical protein
MIFGYMTLGRVSVDRASWLQGLEKKGRQTAGLAPIRGPVMPYNKYLTAFEYVPKACATVTSIVLAKAL